MTTKTNPINTPILFLVFNRLGYTERVFTAIRDARPPRIYIASDGPRNQVKGETTVVKKVRDYILDNIDWDCTVNTLFQERNLGCKLTVAGAINWFFEQEERGIILEDDCLPNKSFFWFCEQALELYKNHTQVGMITGTSYLFNEVTSSDFFFFSRYAAIWGWATWRDRWQWYDLDMRTLPNSNKEIKRFFYWDRFISTWYKNIFKEVYNHKIDTWDIQWTYTCVTKNAYCLTPYKNLVRNIGVTGTRKGDTSPFVNMDTIELPIFKNQLIPIPVTHNFEVDKKLFNNVFYRFITYRCLKIFLMKINLYIIISKFFSIIKKFIK